MFMPEIKKIELDEEIAALIAKNYQAYTFSKRGLQEIPNIVDDNVLFINKQLQDLSSFF